jgi:hypothetical protein
MPILLHRLGGVGLRTLGPWCPSEPSTDWIYLARDAIMDPAEFAHTTAASWTIPMLWGPYFPCYLNELRSSIGPVQSARKAFGGPAPRLVDHYSDRGGGPPRG